VAKPGVSKWGGGKGRGGGGKEEGTGGGVCPPVGARGLCPRKVFKLQTHAGEF
jgi:hypothetical protein